MASLLIKAPAQSLQKNAERRFGRLDRELSRAYLSGTSQPKLHLGCGPNALPGWLNTDLEPITASIMHMDATDHFPLADCTFDFAFSEHMIEHVPYSSGKRMLAECFRVLKPNGVLRVSTPDLEFVLGMRRPELTELQKSYLDWFGKMFSPANQEEHGTAFFLNRFVRSWGHEFIYDESTLKGAMAEVGFKSLTSCALRESRHPALCDLEHESRLPPGFLRLETMTIEGTKPAA